MTALRVHLLRGGVPESSHDVHGAWQGPDDRAEGFGDPDRRAFWRSAMKPFQALPLARAGTLAGLGLGERELALACASHHATPEQVAIVERVLEALGLDQDALACGPHRPMDEEAARALDEAGRLPGRIHHNCSGKHAAMLAVAVERGWPLEGYHLPEHPVQLLIREELRSWLDSDPHELPWGVDGCGVPTPALRLTEMARAYARLAASEEPAARAVASAMTRNPSLVSGPTAFSARLMTATAGRLLGKEGAEGVFCVACPGEGWGAAFKVADGAMRALGPALVVALEHLGLLKAEERERLGEVVDRPVENSRGEPVAVLRAELARD